MDMILTLFFPSFENRGYQKGATKSVYPTIAELVHVAPLCSGSRTVLPGIRRERKTVDGGGPGRAGNSRSPRCRVRRYKRGVRHHLRTDELRNDRVGASHRLPIQRHSCNVVSRISGLYTIDDELRPKVSTSQPSRDTPVSSVLYEKKTQR